MSNIFNGKIVNEISMPKKSLTNSAKQDWGMEQLGIFVAVMHGVEYRNSAQCNGNKFGKLTGIQIHVQVSEKMLTYALIEPKQNPDKKVLISKSEEIIGGAGIMDIIDHELKEGGELESPLAAAFRRASINKEVLPENKGLLILQVHKHPIKGIPALEPAYLENDDAVEGKKSMRIFYGKPPKGLLRVGQVWSARIKKIHPTNSENTKGALMVHVDVVLLEAV